jgi:hypothetical protein
LRKPVDVPVSPDLRLREATGKSGSIYSRVLTCRPGESNQKPRVGTHGIFVDNWYLVVKNWSFR